MALANFTIAKYQKLKLPLFVCSVMLLMIHVSFYHCFFVPLYFLFKLLCSVSLVLLAGRIQLEVTPICKHLRKLSTLFFMLHFIWNSIITSGFNICLNKNIINEIRNIPYYFIILLLTWMSSELILLLSNKKYFTWLKYSY